MRSGKALWFIEHRDLSDPLRQLRSFNAARLSHKWIPVIRHGTAQHTPVRNGEKERKRFTQVKNAIVSFYNRAQKRWALEPNVYHFFLVVVVYFFFFHRCRFVCSYLYSQGLSSINKIRQLQSVIILACSVDQQDFISSSLKKKTCR